MPAEREVAAVPRRRGHMEKRQGRGGGREGGLWARRTVDKEDRDCGFRRRERARLGEQA